MKGRLRSERGAWKGNEPLSSQRFVTLSNSLADIRYSAMRFATVEYCAASTCKRLSKNGSCIFAGSYDELRNKIFFDCICGQTQRAKCGMSALALLLLLLTQSTSDRRRFVFRVFVFFMLVFFCV
jgi:hypothetical protein